MNPSKVLGIILVLVFAIFYIFIPIIVSGDFKWMEAWVYAFVVLIFSIVSRIMTARKNPGLIKERATFLSAEGIKSWDKKLVPLIAYVFPYLILLIAGLDHRFVWSRSLPGILMVLSFILFLAGYGFSIWAMMENRFFSSVVRIQKDRGQTVCETGPYRWVRHPGYVGGLIAWIVTPILLGSLWSFIPVFIELVLYAVRTKLEDETLKKELPGYQEYAQKVRYRLVPGIW